jgi:hypothetical protein
VLWCSSASDRTQPGLLLDQRKRSRRLLRERSDGLSERSRRLLRERSDGLSESTECMPCVLASLDGVRCELMHHGLICRNPSHPVPASTGRELTAPASHHASALLRRSHSLGGISPPAMSDLYRPLSAKSQINIRLPTIAQSDCHESTTPAFWLGAPAQPSRALHIQRHTQRRRLAAIVNCSRHTRTCFSAVVLPVDGPRDTGRVDRVNKALQTTRGPTAPCARCLTPGPTARFAAATARPSWRSPLRLRRLLSVTYLPFTMGLCPVGRLRSVTVAKGPDRSPRAADLAQVRARTRARSPPAPHRPRRTPPARVRASGTARRSRSRPCPFRSASALATRTQRGLPSMSASAGTLRAGSPAHGDAMRSCAVAVIILVIVGLTWQLAAGHDGGRQRLIDSHHLQSY